MEHINIDSEIDRQKSRQRKRPALLQKTDFQIAADHLEGLGLTILCLRFSPFGTISYEWYEDLLFELCRKLVLDTDFVQGGLRPNGHLHESFWCDALTHDKCGVYEFTHVDDRIRRGNNAKTVQILTTSDLESTKWFFFRKIEELCQPEEGCNDHS